MREYAQNVQASELALVDVTANSGQAASAVDATPAEIHRARAAAARPSSEDPFLAKAKQEHAAGHVDPTLWARAVARAGDDNALAKRLYLNSRATELRIARRDEEAERSARVIEAFKNAPEPGFAPEEPPAVPKDNALTRRGGAVSKRARALLIVGVLGCVAVGAAAVAFWPASGPGARAKLAAPAPAGDARANGARAAPAKAAGASGAATEAVPVTSVEAIVARIPALEEAGNWNLVVIHAAEWTRKQPASAAAWTSLGRAYLKLRQLGDALDAATRATQLAPDDFLAWRSLGQVYAALQRPAEARAAFEKALALSPGDVETICGAAWAARKEGRQEDAEAMVSQATLLSGGCRDPDAGKSVRVVVGSNHLVGAH